MLLRNPVLLFLLASLAAASAFANSLAPDFLPTHDAVVNGREPLPGSPFSRSIVLIISDAGSCTGTILSERLVVTAGHCVTYSGTRRTVSPATVLVHFTRYYDGEESHPRTSTMRARAMRLHPGYNPSLIERETLPRDLALLLLPASPPAGYRPATMLPRSLRLAVGDEVVAAGMGNRAFRGESSDHRLLTFEFRVANLSAESTLATLEASRFGGIASGDSGGPAWVRKNGEIFFWGVASSSEEEGAAEAAYENLERYREWLEKTASDLGAPLRLP